MKYGLTGALSIAILLSATCIATAGDHAVDTSTLRGAAAQSVSTDAARRDAILSTLDRPAVREAADAAGLDIVRARDAVSTLSSAELETISQQAAQVDAALDGGDTIVISASAVIIILLILILIAVS